MATDTADLIERITIAHSLVNVSLSLRGESGPDEYRWGCSAQWESDGEGAFRGRGVVSAYGADPVAAILNCVGRIVIAQNGSLPLRRPLELVA
jgi:hypothetical protein